LPSIYASFSDEPKAKELEDFVKSNVSDDGLTKAHQVAGEIRFKAELKRRELPALEQWLTAHLSTLQ